MRRSMKNAIFLFLLSMGVNSLMGQIKSPCFDKNPHYVRLSYNKELTGTGLDNEGFKGIGIKAGEKYDFSFYARTVTNGLIKLRINLVNSEHDIYETKEVEINGKDWKKYSVVLTPAATEAHSRLRITMLTQGTADLYLIFFIHSIEL